MTVTISATYNLGSDGYAVSIGVFDLDAWWATGTAQSSQGYTCHAEHTGEAFCGYIPSSRSGSDVVTFELTHNSVKTYRLRASVELYYSNAQLIQGASTFQDFFIVVSQGTSATTASQSTPTTQTFATLTPQVTNPAVTSSAGSLQAGPAQGDGIVYLVIVVGIAVVVGLLYFAKKLPIPSLSRTTGTRKRRQAKRTQASQPMGDQGTLTVARSVVPAYHEIANSAKNAVQRWCEK